MSTLYHIPNFVLFIYILNIKFNVMYEIDCIELYDDTNKCTNFFDIMLDDF